MALSLIVFFQIEKEDTSMQNITSTLLNIKPRKI